MPNGSATSCYVVFLIFLIDTTFQSEIIKKLRNYNLTCGKRIWRRSLLDPKDVRNCRWMENLFGQADIRITGNRLRGFYFVVNIPVVKS